MAVHAAALACRLLFSTFPFMVFLIALLSFVELPVFFGWHRQQAGPFLPPAALAPSLYCSPISTFPLL